MRSPGGVWVVVAALTAVALVEHTWAPWRPFYGIYAALCVALPLWARTPRLRWPNLRALGWAGLIALPLLLQVLTAAWLAAVWPAVATAVRAQADASSIATALPAAIARHADAWGVEPEVLVLRYVLFITVWAGVGEELLYRGYVHEALRERSGVATAAMVSAAWFAVRHAVQLAGGLEYPWLAAASWVSLSFLLGLVFSWLYERTRSLWPPILVHTLFNVIPLVQLLAA